MSSTDLITEVSRYLLRVGTQTQLPKKEIN